MKWRKPGFVKPGWPAWRRRSSGAVLAAAPLSSGSLAEPGSAPGGDLKPREAVLSSFYSLLFLNPLGC